MYSTIVNPITGKTINTRGRLGKKILNNYLIHLGRGGGGHKLIKQQQAYGGPGKISATEHEHPIKVLVICSSPIGSTFPGIKIEIAHKISRHFKNHNIKWDYLGGRTKETKFPTDITSKYNVFIFAGCNVLTWLFPGRPVDSITGMVDLTLPDSINVAMDKFSNNLIKYGNKKPIILFVENTGIAIKGSSVSLNTEWNTVSDENDYTGKNENLITMRKKAIRDNDLVEEGVVFFKINENYSTIPWEYIAINDFSSDVRNYRGRYSPIKQIFDTAFTPVPDQINHWVYYEKK